LKELVDYYEVEEKSINHLMNKKNTKLILKIYKNILKQIKDNPLQNWYEININNYTLKEMRVIKRYFCDWQGFGFKTSKPEDEMVQRNIVSVSRSMSVSSSISDPSSNTIANVTNIEKFYITWFNEN